jgi:hypothetical protein
MIKADNEGDLEGVPTSKRGPRLNHFFLLMIVYCFAEQIWVIGIDCPTY